MEKSKLGLDFQKVKHAKKLASTIAEDVQNFVNKYTTVTVERTLCRLIGIDGVDANDIPLPNVVVNEIQEKGLLHQGILYFLGNAVIETGKTPQSIAEEIAIGNLDITQLKIND
jgi:beta-lysine 5,6-aminomutase alpha subunit